MFCNQCGTQNKDGMAFCEECGAKLAHTVYQAPTPQPMSRPVAQPTPQAPMPQPMPMPTSQPIQQSIPPTPVAPTPMPMMQPNPAPAPKKKGSAKWILYLLGILVVAAICIVVGIAIGGRGKDNDEVEEPKESAPIVIDPVPVNTEAERTVMVYMIGSNLESESGLASEDIDEMLLAKSSDDFKIVIQTGGTSKWQNPKIKAGQVQRFEIKNNRLVELENLGRVSMVEKQTLIDFINYAKENYPAKEYVLVMWNHGGGVPIGFGSDEIFDGTLSDVEIGQAITATDTHFSALIFNACEMCSLELFMSVKDHVDYVVAAESVLYGYGIYGCGIDYTSWINLAIDNKVSTQKYCEQILDDYVKFLGEINSPGSMSVIRMDRVDEVYQAYLNYITAAYEELQKPEGYAAFVQARENCGIYDGTDAVDISTLAAKYENPYSTALQNAVTNAVVRTKSDISYGHGITAYLPYNFAKYYSDGRVSFEELNYDPVIMDFYDLLASKILFYNDQLAYAGDWYIEQKDKKGETHGEQYDLAYTNMGNYQAVALEDSDWEIIKSVKMYVAQDLNDPKVRYLYGSDWQFELDDNSYIKVAPPKYWLFINNYVPTSFCQSYTEEDEAWYQTSLVYAYVNGEEAYLRVDSSTEYPDGTIVGYYLADFNTEEFDEGHSFAEEDVIELAAIIYNEQGEQEIRKIGLPIDAMDLTSEFVSLEYGVEEEVLLFFEITDVYGNIYSTEVTTARK